MAGSPYRALKKPSAGLPCPLVTLVKGPRAPHSVSAANAGIWLGGLVRSPACSRRRPISVGGKSPLPTPPPPNLRTQHRCCGPLRRECHSQLVPNLPSPLPQSPLRPRGTTLSTSRSEVVVGGRLYGWWGMWKHSKVQHTQVK